MTVRQSAGDARRHAGAGLWGWTMPQRWDVDRPWQAPTVLQVPESSEHQTVLPIGTDEIVPGAWETDGGDVRWTATAAT